MLHENSKNNNRWHSKVLLLKIPAIISPGTVDRQLLGWRWVRLRWFYTKRFRLRARRIYQYRNNLDAQGMNYDKS